MLISGFVLTMSEEEAVLIDAGSAVDSCYL